MSKRNIVLMCLASVIALALILFALSVYTGYEPAKDLAGITKKKPATVTLEFWGVWDSSDSWQKIIEKFESETHFWKGQEVKVKVNYTKKDFSSYEADLDRTYQDGTTPSVFLINNYWLGRYADKLSPLSGSVATIDSYELMDYEELSDIFPPYILQDVFYGNNEMYALPIYSDSLALYYNKDLFQKAGIDQAPATWDEVKADLKKLTLIDKKNQISQSGIALGGGKEINRSCDIFALLTMQGGGKVIDADGKIDFNQKVSIPTSAGSKEREPGLTALQFYMEFSDTDKDNYSWNNTLSNSVQDFADGKVAMMLNYNYQRANLLALKPELNYSIAPVPQLAGSTSISISNVWFPVVSEQSSCKIEGGEDLSCPDIAWSFLSFANQKENIATYLESTGKASARIDLSAEQAAKEDKLAPFAKQASIARSYDKFDDSIDTILTQMLDAVYTDRTAYKAKADEAATKIDELRNKTN